MPASRCRCTWEVVNISPEVEQLWLRAMTADDCEVHMNVPDFIDEEV